MIPLSDFGVGLLGQEPLFLSDLSSFPFSSVSKNSESSSAFNSHSINTQTAQHTPIIPRTILNEENLLPRSPVPEQVLSDLEGVSSSLVLYGLQDINTPPNQQLLPSSHLLPPLCTPTPDISTLHKEPTSSKRLTDSSLISTRPHPFVPPVIQLDSLTSTQHLKPAIELPAQSITSPEPVRPAAVVQIEDPVSETDPVAPKSPPVPKNYTPAASILPSLSEVKDSASKAIASVLVLPQAPKTNTSATTDSVSEAKQLASVFVPPQVPENNISTHGTVPVISNPLSPGFAQLSESSSPSPNDNLFLKPGSTSELSDPALPNQLSEVEVIAQRVAAPSPLLENPVSSPSSPGFSQLSESSLEYLPPSPTDNAFLQPGSTFELSDPASPNQLPEVEVPSALLENPVNSVATPPEPVPQSSTSNICLGNSSAEPSSASRPSIPPSFRDLAPSTPAPDQSLETNHWKTPFIAIPIGTLTATPDPFNMTPTGMTICKRTKKRLVIEDSDDDSRPIPPVVDVSRAAIASPTINAPPPGPIPVTLGISLPPAPAPNSTVTAGTATCSHTVDLNKEENEIRDWPDPDGKLTAAQIRPILEANHVHFKSADPKLVLLTKYKLLFADKQQNAPRYNLRRPASVTAIKKQVTAEAQAVADPQTNVITNDINLIDMHNSDTTSIQPLNPTVAQPTQLPRPISVNSASRSEPVQDPFLASRLEPEQDPARPEPVQDPARPEPVQDPARPEPVQDPARPEPVQDPARPKPLQESVSHWASDVLMSHRDDKNVASSQPNLEALVSSLNSFARTSVQIGTASLNSIRMIAKGFTSLNSTIAGLSCEGVFNTQATPASSTIPATREGPQIVKFKNMCGNIVPQCLAVVRVNFPLLPLQRSAARGLDEASQIRQMKSQKRNPTPVPIIPPWIRTRILTPASPMVTGPEIQEQARKPSELYGVQCADHA
ncbi:hypothetical protein PtB15_12B198 [Puccinia triticina]|nr:hypothetical protein PtB15_12B198 [Puccinia triticina]